MPSILMEAARSPEMLATATRTASNTRLDGGERCGQSEFRKMWLPREYPAEVSCSVAFSASILPCSSRHFSFLACCSHPSLACAVWKYCYCLAGSRRASRRPPHPHRKRSESREPNLEFFGKSVSVVTFYAFHCQTATRRGFRRLS